MNSSIGAAKRLTLAELSTLPVTKEAVIGEEHLDFNRHMNVSWYIHLFNQATGSIHKQLGFDWSRIDIKQSSSFILEGHIRYLAEVMGGDHVTLRTRLISQTPKRIHFLHFMSNDDRRTLAATYEKVVAHIDMSTRQMSPFPESSAEQMRAMLKEHQALSWDPPVCGVMHA